MAEYPKNYAKGDVTKVAHNRRDEVKLKFDGFREEQNAPELTEAEMAQLPEAKDAEVVDTTKPEAGKSNTAPRK